MNFEELCANISVSLLSGVISGLVVYFVTKHREHKYLVYAYWENFLFRVLSRFDIDIPSDALRYVADVGDRESKWQEAINNVMDIVYQPDVENRIMTDEEEKLSDNTKIALDELHKWARANKLSSKKR